MRTINGTTITHPREETFRICDELAEIHGKNVCTPSCTYCGQSTEFIVEECEPVGTGVRFKRPGVNVLYAIRLPIHVALNRERTKAYIPVTICIKCTARADAADRFLRGLSTHGNINDRGYTDEELERYTTYFNLKMGDMQRADERRAGSTKLKS